MIEEFEDGESLGSIRDKINSAIREILAVQASFPKVIRGVALPSVQQGYYRNNGIGDFLPEGSYWSYTFLKEALGKEVYVSGTIKDSGTALAFYYREDGTLISVQTPGGAQAVVYDKQRLNIPEGTNKINITVLKSGGAPKVFSEEISTDLLSKSLADTIYISILTGDSRYLSSELGADIQKIISVYPRDLVERNIPNSQPGYYRTTNGGDFFANATYASVTLDVSTYTPPIYVSGQMKDAGTALAFYYRSDGSLISFEFRGTASTVLYNKQKLTIPSGTTKIGLTVLAAGGAPKVYTGVLASGLLSLSDAIARFITPELAAQRFADINLLPSTPTAEEIIFNNTDFSLATNTGGDTHTSMYVVMASKTTKAGTVLKRGSVKVTGATTLFIEAVTLSTVGGVLLYTKVHAFDPIVLNAAGEVNLSFSDTFQMPVDCYLAIGDTNKKLSYANDPGATNSYRLEIFTKKVTTSSAKMAFNFVTSDASITKDILLTQKQAEERFTKIGKVSTGIPIYFQKQPRFILSGTDKILLYGTSIMSTDYPWLKTHMEALTGATVYNGGFSGYTAAQLAKNAQFQRIIDYAAKIVIIEFGGNDTGAMDTVGTFSDVNGEPVVAETDISVDYNGTFFIQAVSHTIRKFISQYNNIRARAGLTGSETEAEKTSKIDALLKPYLAFATSLPQKRNNDADPFTAKANWQRKRDAIVECCNKYNVHCIDLFNLLGWDMSIEPYWVSPTDKVNNRGVYTMDGLHPNKFGYEHMARILTGSIGIVKAGVA